MELELNGDEDDLIAYYKMSNGSGVTLTDNSSNSYTGTEPIWITVRGSNLCSHRSVE